MDLQTRAIGIRLTRSMRRELERTTREMLGRLQRRIRGASLTLAPDDDKVDPSHFICDVQLSLGDASPIRVCYRGEGKNKVVNGALRRARHALLRRRIRTPVLAHAGA